MHNPEEEKCMSTTDLLVSAKVARRRYITGSESLENFPG